MASEVKEETNSTPSDTKNEVDEKVKEELNEKLNDGEKDGLKNESKEESGKATSIDESKSKKEEDDDEEEEEDEEEEVGLLDRPVEVTGCRARKKVERLDVSFSTPKEKQEFQEGKGKKLGDCPRIEMQIQKSKVQDLKPLHKLLFNRIGAANEIKKNLRKFSGFAFEEDSTDFNRKKASIEKMTMPVLKQACLILDIERGGSKKGDITSRLLNFLMKPEDSGKKVPSAKKKTPKEKKASTKKGKSEKKAKADKSENSAEESEKSEEDDDDDSAGGDASMGGTDEENEAEIESDEEPKKKSKDAKSSKGKSKTEKVKKEEKKSKGTKRKADEDSKASSDEEPVEKSAKKSKMPTDEEISKLVKQILESADLQEITMKKVIKQVSDAYPDHDLSHKKAFIKQTIKSVIS